MPTSPDNPPFIRSESVNSPPQLKAPNWLSLNRETFNHLSSMAAGAVLSETTASFLYKINYQIFGLLDSQEALTVLDKFHNLNLGMSVMGGILAGDFIYRSWKASQATSQ